VSEPIRAASEIAALLGDAEEARRARDWHRAEALYACALELDPTNVAAALNRSTALLTIRRAPEAIDLLHRFRSLSNSQEIRSNLLFAGLYSEVMDDRQRARLHVEIGRELGVPGPRVFPPLASGERMRIGYISSQFRLDPEIFFHLPTLEQHDRDRFAIYCYSLAADEDDWTARFAAHADEFRSLAPLSDDDAIERIRLDHLHVLIDWSGHVGGARPRILARRAAPIQVSSTTFAATTGLEAMDFRFADEHTDPVGTAPDLYCESLVYLECGHCCYGPPVTVDPGPPPFEQQGGITFGVFNRPGKITDRFLDACAAIVRGATGSRILFHHVYNGGGPVAGAYVDPVVRRFAAAGVAADRVLFVGGRPLEEHFHIVKQADIALDTHPYSGKTTTCECLWMGVPVITIAGGAHVSRVGVSLLHSVALEDWVATSGDDFVRLAIEKANAREELRRLRRELRGRMQRSPLTNPRVHARTWEASYRLMWEQSIRAAGRSH
jgi:protein O-GlcNAc transferase